MPLIQKPNMNSRIQTIRQNAAASIFEHVKRVAEKHEGVVEGWEKSRDVPRFKASVNIERAKIVGSVLMSGRDAQQAQITVWQLLDQGTKVRFMQLSSDWQSKTAPGQLRSGPGRGKKMGIDKEAPEPGIRARKFGETVAKEMKGDADKSVQEGYSGGFRR